MDRRVKKTKGAIQAAYFSLLFKKDPRKITISEISRIANIDRKTFYLHYNSIDDIMEDFCLFKFNELKEQLEEKGFFEEPLNVSIVLNSLNEILEEDIELYRKFARNINFDIFWTMVKDLMIETVLNFYRDMLNIPESYLRIYAEFLATGTIRVYMSWLKEELNLPIEDLGNAVCAIIFNGIQPFYPELKPYMNTALSLRTSSFSGNNPGGMVDSFRKNQSQSVQNTKCCNEAGLTNKKDKAVPIGSNHKNYDEVDLTNKNGKAVPIGSNHKNYDEVDLTKKEEQA